MLILCGLIWYVGKDRWFKINKFTVIEFPTTVVKGKSVNAKLQLPDSKVTLESNEDEYEIKGIEFLVNNGKVYLSYDIKANKHVGYNPNGKFIGWDSEIYDNEGNRIYWEETVALTRMKNGETITENLEVPLSSFSKNETYEIRFSINEEPDPNKVEAWTETYNSLSLGTIIEGSARAVSAAEVEMYLDQKTSIFDVE